MFPEKIRNVFLFSRERTSEPQSQFIDLTEPSYGEFGMLAEDVSRSQGRAVIIVHPFYHKREDRIGLSLQYKHDLKNIFATSDRNQEPVILFEEAGSVGSLLKKLPEKRVYYLIQTISGDPAPLNQAAYNSGGYDYGPVSKDMALDHLAQQFSKAGIKTVSIAGRYYFVDPVGEGNKLFYNRMHAETETNPSARQWTERGLYPDGCVSAVIRSLLRNGLEVDLTNALSPNTPKPQDMRNSRLDFGV